jgi:hypothetical protein
MNTVPILTKNQLKEANAWAIEMGYNRAIEPKPLQEYLDTMDDSAQFPITFHMLHEHAGGVKVEEHVRCMVVLNGEGSRAMIDIDLDFFNRLNTIEVPETMAISSEE